MELGLVIQIGRELLFYAMLLSLPTVLVSMAVGLTISILQTVTSIQEQTLTFAPRIVAVGVTFMLTLPWVLEVLVQFGRRMFVLIAEITQ